MGARTLLLISLALNVALAAAFVAWLTSARRNSPAVVRPINTAIVQSNHARFVLKTNVLIRPRTFTWQEVESPDYAVYVTNLRQLGMPESTVRDIIVADIDQIFNERKREQALKEDVEWWRSTPSTEAQSAAIAKANEIENERVALLNKLLGPDWQQGRVTSDTLPIALVGPVLESLPDETKASVRSIAERSRTRVSDFIAQAQAAGEAVNPAELARLREDTRRELAAVLSPAALEEFLLRYSENASQLRRELAGFNATPDEFRALFRAVDNIERDLQLRASGNDADSLRLRQALEEQRIAAVRKALGPERFADYQGLMDPVYREAAMVARQAGGDEETVQALYQINRTAAQELERIRANASLTEAQKQEQLRAAEAEQQKARALVLGETIATEVPATSPTATAEPPTRAHAIIPGDTLGILALRYGVSVNALREANPGVDVNRARAGTTIIVPPPGTGTQQPLPPLPPGVPRR
jgi:LysM repeat protein